MGSNLLSSLMHPEDAERVMDNFASFATLREGEIREIEYRMRHADGEWRWIRSRDAVFKYTNEGRPEQIVGTAQDITMQKRYEEQIEQYMMQVNETNVHLQWQQIELAEANARLEDLATTDGLTGLKNHRLFQEKSAEEFERSQRYRSPLSVIMLDVDKFKSYNDTFGHPAGDQVLKRVAAVMKATVRRTDLVARYGGEEFAILLPETAEEGARELAERLRAAIETQPWNKRPVTISIGVATLERTTSSFSVLLKQADEALYASKAGGRNRVPHFLWKDETIAKDDAGERTAAADSAYSTGSPNSAG